MFLRFKKKDFLVTYQEQKRGTLVTVTRDNFPNQLLRFGMVVPGNVYMLSGAQWTLLDISGMIHFERKFRDHVEKAAEALSIVITKLPIGDSYLQLCYAEYKIFEALGYDIAVKGSVDWLPIVDIHYFNDQKMIGVKGSQMSVFPIPQTREELTGWNPRTAFVPKVINTAFPKIKKPETPRIVISPAVTPVSLRSPVPSIPVTPTTGPVVVELQVVQKTPLKKESSQPLVLPPITIKPDPDYVPNRNPTKDEGHKAMDPRFYAMAERRGKWKREHPNWREEMYPNYKEDHERYMKHKTEQREKDRLAAEQKKIDDENRYQELKAAWEKEAKHEDKTDPSPTTMAENITLNEDGDGPAIVADDVFVRAAEYSKRISQIKQDQINQEHVNKGQNKQDHVNKGKDEDVESEEWSFGEITAAAPQDDLEPSYDEDDLLMEEVVDGMFYDPITTLPVGDDAVTMIATIPVKKEEEVSITGTMRELVEGTEKVPVAPEDTEDDSDDTEDDSEEVTEDDSAEDTVEDPSLKLALDLEIAAHEPTEPAPTEPSPDGTPMITTGSLNLMIAGMNSSSLSCEPE